MMIEIASMQNVRETDHDDGHCASAMILIDGIPAGFIRKRRRRGLITFVCDSITVLVGRIWTSESKARRDVVAYLNEGVVPS